MSWSTSATGKAAEVKEKMEKAFSEIKVSEPVEQETVNLIGAAIVQCLSTFDPEKSVTVGAYGHMAYRDWQKKEGAYQQVSVTIAP